MIAVQAVELEVDKSDIDSCQKALLSKERERAIDRHLHVVVRFDSCCCMIRLRNQNLAHSVVDRKEILAAHAMMTEAYVVEKVS